MFPRATAFVIKSSACSPPFVSMTRPGCTWNHSPTSSRSGVYPAPAPYERIVLPSRASTVPAQSASSSSGSSSGAGAPRAKEIVSTTGLEATEEATLGRDGEERRRLRAGGRVEVPLAGEEAQRHRVCADE